MVGGTTGVRRTGKEDALRATHGPIMSCSRSRVVYGSSRDRQRVVEGPKGLLGVALGSRKVNRGYIKGTPRC